MSLIIIALLLGVTFGIITGLIPGVHVNLIAILLLSFVPYLSNFFSEIDLGVFLISMVMVHSFLDFIPSIFLGAPEGETALSVLPGHDFLLNGRGYDALKFTICGGIGASILSILFIPLLFLFLESAYSQLSHFIVPLLIIFSILFIIKEKRKLWASTIFLLSGVLGLIVLNGINIKQPLFPLLSGLFGIPVLVISLFNKDKLIIQRLSNNIKLLKKNRILSYFKAAISSVLVSIMPGVGSAQAAIIASGFSRYKNNEDFLVTIGGINTSGALFTLSVFYILGKARTGVMSSLQQLLSLNLQNYLILLLTGLVSVGFGVVISLKIGKLFATRISKINYRKVSKFIILIIIILVVIITGCLGLIVLSVASAIGLLAPNVRVRRIHLMGCLIIPVIFYYIL